MWRGVVWLLESGSTCDEWLEAKPVSHSITKQEEIAENMRRRYNRELYGAGEKPKKVFTSVSGGGSIDLRQYPVTQKSIESVPLVKPASMTDEQAARLQDAHKALLEMVKDKPVGTEAFAVYTPDMTRLIKSGVGEDGAQEVRIPSVKEPHVILHNHPDGMTFSSSDIEGLVLSHPSGRVLSAVGNDGTVYLLERGEEFDAAGFIRGFVSVDLNNARMYDNPQEYAKAMRSFLEGAEKYGFAYYEGKPRVF